ncbi:hypothetical protein [Mycoplasmopsis arginini]|uniref:hypothetical protein n=1 Tax=Mycoplasmopsis arginini TaxID=2094 RepID=UPI00249E6683|nr:hypothetical protein [Mycoplasmopsis arginini]MDI3350480.1 hypothetical protein [Mycoplasmopsis arginini]MDI3350808.1 hypothetical protein [Mycoplasmopsis arginini]
MSKAQMTLSELMKSSNNVTNDIFDILNVNRPNSKEAYLTLGAKIQANTLAFKLPDVKFKDTYIQKLWDDFITRNKFLEIIQQLETNLYRNGIYAIGISNNLTIFLAKVSEYKIVENKLVKLSIIIDTINHQNQQYDIIKEYDLFNKANNNINDLYVSTYAKRRYDNKNISLNSFKDLNFSYLDEKKQDFIPWIIFKNNYLSNSEIDDVDSSLFKMLDNSLECLLRDNFWSNPFIFITDNFAIDSAQNIKDAVYDFGKRVIQSNSLSFNSVGNPIEFHQGSSNTQFIIQKIDKLNYLIKDQMFFKMNSADFGTKNMHNAEFENLNSNFKAYVESKANSREEYYGDFIKLFLRIVLNKENIEFEVTVPNSTKYLKSKEAIYASDINGIALNNGNEINIKNEDSNDD